MQQDTLSRGRIAAFVIVVGAAFAACVSPGATPATPTPPASSSPAMMEASPSGMMAHPSASGMMEASPSGMMAHPSASGMMEASPSGMMAHPTPSPAST